MTERELNVYIFGGNETIRYVLIGDWEWKVVNENQVIVITGTDACGIMHEIVAHFKNVMLDAKGGTEK